MLNIPIPILKDEIHNKIRQYIISSQNVLNNSKKLLECAKTSVEMAIEQDETTAVYWLKSKISELTKV